DNSSCIYFYSIFTCSYFDGDPSAAMFHIEPHHNISGFWSIWFTNNFEFSIELNEVYVSSETRNILKILNFAEPLTLSPGCWNVFSLKLDVKDNVTNVLSSICLATSVGVMIEIPLQIYSTVSKQADLHFEVIAHCDVQCYLGKSDSGRLVLTFFKHALAVLFGINIEAINFTTTEFRLMDEYSPRNAHQEDLISKKCSSELLQLNLQPLETRKVGVIFTPVDYKRVASIILIRNNLTVLDVVNVEGYGARELLKVGGRLPGAGGSLRFKVPEATLMDCRRQLKDSKQILSITKNFKVENIGPLPITISSMKINGYSCQGYGFEVLDCQEFFLAQNSSREISIVFTPDFTSSWVIRELTLVTAADLEFHFTLNVTLPHHLLPLCADVVPGPSWEESFWRLTVLFVRWGNKSSSEFCPVQYFQGSDRGLWCSFSSQANLRYFLIVGNNHQALLRNETENCESLKKQINIKPSTEKKINKGRKEETLCCTKEEIISSEVCLYAYVKTITARDIVVNHKSEKNYLESLMEFILLRVSEQSELKYLCNEYERLDLRANIGIRAWHPQGDRENCKADQKPGSLSIHGETGENISQNDFPSETPITLNLSHNICNTSRDMNSLPQYPDTLCPNFTDIAADPETNKAHFSFSWDSFIDWNATCDSQFSNVYCPFEMNEYGAIAEENMNYSSSFPGTAAMQNTAFIDQSCTSTWNAPHNMPPTWEPASYVNSTPYLSSTRSLSPMSGLFGSIWAPQSDVYESCCPVSATTQHSTHVENQAVMCKQEYYPRFNPFRAYMNLDIWTAAPNRNPNFPLSRDSGYCGNV
ncbi:hypothetical protein CIB84_001674, partial [Bambusicola thoracicus]